MAVVCASYFAAAALLLRAASASSRSTSAVDSMLMQASVTLTPYLSDLVKVCHSHTQSMAHSHTQSMACRATATLNHWHTGTQCHLPWVQLLVALMDVRFDHDTDDGLVARCDLLGHVRCHDGLVGVLLQGSTRCQSRCARGIGWHLL